MPFTDSLSTQFEHPRGTLGALAGMIMAHRPEDIARGRWILDKLAPDPTARVLELGSGPGVALHETCRRIPDGHVVGIDFSTVMLHQSRRRNRAFIEAGRLEIRFGDATDLDPDLRNFDLIYGINVWQFWNDANSALADQATRLRPDGRLALAYTQPAGSTLTPGRAATKLAAQLTATSLTHIDVEWMPAKHPTVLVSGRQTHS